MKIPFNDTSRIIKKYDSDLLSRVEKIIKSGWWLLGDQTQTFSKAFASYCGTQFCVPVANGTDALEIALRAVLGKFVRTETEVITVANAGGYSTTACRLVGVKPVYVDVKPENLLIDLESLLHNIGPKVKAIIITHLYGGAVDIPLLREMLNKNGYSNIPIIEDCAQAHGAKIEGMSVGSFGDVATFSFYPTKNLGALGDAGAIVTSTLELYNKVKMLQQYGWSKKYNVEIPNGRNSRIDEVQAGVLNYLLPFLDENNQIRKKIYEKYSNSIYSEKIAPLIYKNDQCVFHLAVFLVKRRHEFIEFMANKGISLDVHYPILDSEQSGWKNLSMRVDKYNDLKVSKQIVNNIVSIPCFPELKSEEIEYICAALKEWQERD